MDDPPHTSLKDSLSNTYDGQRLVRRPKRSSLASLAYEAIVEAIVDRQLQPGTHLAIEVLATDLDMSTTPVREALMRAAAERLVIQDRKNRGFMVAPLLSEAEYHQLFDVRHLLEMHALHIAQPDQKAIQQLTEIVNRMPSMEHGSAYRDFRTFSQADSQFHKMLVRMSRNTFLIQSWENFHFHLHVGRLYAGAGVIDFGDALREHMAIAKALDTGDQDEAVRCLNRHIKQAERRLESLVHLTVSAE